LRYGNGQTFIITLHQGLGELFGIDAAQNIERGAGTDAGDT
jgi:hypothetical protein